MSTNDTQALIKQARELAFSMTHSAGQWMVPGWDGYKVATLLEHLAAIASRQDQQGQAWQDISSAPKDGRIVLYWVASVRFEEDEETGQLREIDVSAADLGCWMPPGGHGEGYHDPFAGIPGDQGGVTHWMNVPAAPLHHASKETAP